ncbi:MAG: TrkH family potassium uptake protein [Bacteroidia bacterium]|nr:TrkH family potassium uptake protein [Bacteroidia bacterium]
MKKTASGYRLIFGYLGIFLVLIGLICLLPLLVLFFYPNEAGVASNFYIVAIVTIVVGLILSIILLRGRQKERLGKHQDFILLLLIWILAILIGSLPFFLRGDMNFTQSIFEATSGYTSTGLTVFDFSLDPNIYGFHVYAMYRSLLIFFGAVGLVLVLVSALSDRYGMRLYSSEGHNDKLLPNLAKSSRLILSIYSGIIIIGTLAYYFAGMDLFDSINHSITAVGTGGFSTNALGVHAAGGNAIAVEIISVFLMLAGATNFVVHLLIIRGRFKKAFRDIEVRFLLLLLLIFIPLFVASAYFTHSASIGELNFVDSLRLGIFYMVSSVTTTGFSSFQPIVYLGPSMVFMSSILMLIGGALGSTSGGIKQLRMASVLKGIFYSISDRFSSKRIMRPRFFWRYGEENEFTPDHFSESVLFVILNLFVLFVGTIAITIIPIGIGFDDALYEVASALSNTGLSVGVTYAGQHPGVLWILTIVMFVGRLEIVPVYYAFLRISRDIIKKETI